MTLNQASKIQNFKTKQFFSLQPLTKQLPNQESLVQDIYACCTEEEIYNWLFQKIFPEGYTLKNAVGFIEYGEKGWNEGTHFIYAILSQDPVPKLVGAIDIKSSNLDEAEVGYWLSKDYSGLMTNALNQIIQLAKENQYKKLIAYTDDGNTSSEKVLKRANFKYTHDKVEDGELTHYFELLLK